MKWLVSGWILFVYSFFCWNVFPDVYVRTLARFAKTVKEKISPEGTPAQTVKHDDLNFSQSSAQQESKPNANPPQPLNSSKRTSYFFINLVRVGIAIWIFFLSYCCGKKLLGRFNLKVSADETALSATLGLAFLSYLVLGIGTIGLLKRGWLLFFMCACSILCLGFCKPLKNFKENLSILKDRAGLVKDKFGTPLLFFSCFIFVILFLKAFVPDQFYDSLSYHLALPQTYLNAGKIVSVPYNVHSSFPQTMEMLYALGLGIGGDDSLALLVQLGCGFLLYFLLLSRGGVASIVWLTCPLVVENLTFAKSDIFFSLLVTSAFFIIADWKEDKGRAPIIVAALLTGFALGTKYTALFFALSFLLFLFYKSWPLSLKAQSKLILTFVAIAFIIFLPWLIKNGLTFGNPFYPFLQDWFGFKYMRPENWTHLIAENRQYWSSHWQWSDLLRTIWRATFYGYQYPSMNFIGPVWLAYLPILFYASLKSDSLKLPSLFVFITLLIQTTQTTLARYFFLPILPILSWSIVNSIDAIKDSRFKKTLIRFMVGGALLHAVGWLPTLERVSYGRVALFGLSEEKKSLLYSPKGTYEAAQWINANLSRSSKVLFLGETRSRLFQREALAPSVHNEHFLSVQMRHSNSGEQLYRNLKETGLTHLLFNKQELLRIKIYPIFQIKPAAVTVLRDFWMRHLEELYSNENVAVYAIAERIKTPSPFPSELEQFFN